jgi:hypothetical protein
MGLYEGPIAGCEADPYVSAFADALCTVAATLRALWTWRLTRRRCLGYALITLWFLAMSW